MSSLQEVNARAEIIQFNYTLARNELETGISVLEVFIDSSPHKNIIESDYKAMSVGVFISDDDDLWVTIRFY